MNTPALTIDWLLGLEQMRSEIEQRELERVRDRTPGRGR